MNMARSTFYKRPHAGHRAAREKADADLRVRIEDILAEFPAYGYRRVTHELRRRGLVINHKRVARVMREHALTPHRVRMARYDEQRSQAAHLPEPEIVDHS